MSFEKVIDDKISHLLMKINKQKLPKHVAIIMDGNGRWATRKGLPRSFGHKQGVTVLKKILKAAKNLGCKIITVYAFSTENWTRPTKEVDFLIDKLESPFIKYYHLFLFETSYVVVSINFDNNKKKLNIIHSNFENDNYKSIILNSVMNWSVNNNVDLY